MDTTALDILPLFQNFATALLIGALLGIEREKRKRSDHSLSIGGLRTFILFSLLGALAGWLSVELQMPVLLLVALVSISALVGVGYASSMKHDVQSVGITTELAAITAFLLGAMVMFGYREIAVALAVTVAAILAYKEPLHGVVDRIGTDDVFAVLRLLIATFIVLPLLPDEPIDPWGALNLYSLWLLVLLISSLSLVGYVASRLLGPERGVLFTGISGGLVSSTAVTLALARQSREKTAEHHALASGILLAWSVMFVRIIVVVMLVNHEFLFRFLAIFGAMAIVTLLAARILYGRTTRKIQANSGLLPLKNPFSLISASKFAIFFAVIMLIVKIAGDELSSSSLYIVAALAGVADVDAITLAMMDVARQGKLVMAVNAIVIASLANTAVKTGMVVVLGAPELRKGILLSALAVTLTGVLAIAWL